jgi:arsenate reductase (thioredoxin)
VKRVLFACVGNAMRSQMAEGLGRALARPGTVEVRSGGTQPAGFVHPKAVRSMKRRGIDITGHHSKPLDLEFARDADAIVTLCGPLDDACPAILFPKVIDWTMPDPSWSDDAEVDQIREAIERKLVALYRDWGVLREGAPARP